ncbi:hypothetical protein [Paenibacillus jilunlii]|uniref:Uncharacterized protein n=1 Tax=Paenibacillus jilunlii TaxID=682956 RepID=A0A1G9SBJ3_9BACL|nr:hypothetical protein [Paenibacillus jilunlii]KWX75360.1 hypothetical protein AML91_12945 [Paenibacillus jilunlii]SDM32707.1 hypothetical protein SAMN05216191_111152 [Paenibacillus jilunlii]
MTYSFVISPVSVQDFESEDELIERCKEWNLLSSTATRVKTYLYKRQGLTLPCEIVGYVDPQTVVIQFENKQQHCIHPAYLKEMQTAAFGSRAGTVSDAVKTEDSQASEAVMAGDRDGDAVNAAYGAEGDENAQAAAALSVDTGAESAKTVVAGTEAEETVAVGTKAEEAVAAGTKAAVAGGVAAGETPEAPKKPAKPKKKPALVLPDEKLQMTATVKEFTTVPNHFSDNDDEVIIYEGVTVEGQDLAIEEVWSSHSATLKKLELAVGDTLSFEAKVVAKKLTQHPVKYKINNPSKIKKLD